METSTEVIFKVDTGQAVKSISDLKTNIQLLNKQLNATTDEEAQAAGAMHKLDIGTEAYQQTLKQLEVNQAALRNAMNGTSAKMDDIVRAAKGQGKTYNALVKQMRELKQEIRNIDVATEEGKEAYKDKAKAINAINDTLKDLDAQMGNYQRNVGNYQSAWDVFGDTLKDMPPFMDKVKRGGENIHKSFGLLATNPVMGTLTLLLPLLFKIAGAIKEDEQVTESFKNVLKAMQPLFDALKAVLEKVAGIVAKVVDWFAKLIVQSKDTFKNIIAGAVGVGNVILQYILGPIRTTIEAFKGLGNIVKDVFTGEFKKVKEDATAAFNGIAEAMKKSFSFKENYNKGKTVAEEFLAGIGSGKKKAEGTGKAIGEELGLGVIEGFETALEGDPLAEFDKMMETAAKDRKALFTQQSKDMEEYAKDRLAWNALLFDDEAERAANAYEIQREANERRLELLRQYQADAEEIMDWDGAAAAEQERIDLELEMERNAYEEKKRLQDLEVENTKKAQQNRISIMQATAGAISSLLGTVADAYEEEAEGNEDAAKKVKALRITAGIIDTISGALTAYTQAMQLGPIAGPIVGAIQAAAVTAAGIAQIAKIKSTKVGSGSDTSSSASVPASIAPPATSVDLPEVRNVTTASEEDRLDRMASSQKVYILNSDLEANEEYHAAQVAEATF